MTGASLLPRRNWNARPECGCVARFNTGSPRAYNVYSSRRFAASMRRQATAFAGSERSGITVDNSQDWHKAVWSPPVTSQLQASFWKALLHRRSPGLYTASCAVTGLYASARPQLTQRLFSKYRVWWQLSQLKSFMG